VVVIILTLTSCGNYEAHEYTKADVPELIRGLDSRSPKKRNIAAMNLGVIGLDSLPALPNLINALADKYSSVRQAAVWAIGEIGPQAIEALPVMISLLEDENSGVREETIYSIGKMGNLAQNSVPKLANLQADGDALIRMAVINTLPKLSHGTETVIALVKGLEDDYIDNRQMAQEQLLELIMNEGCVSILKKGYESILLNVQLAVIRFIGENASLCVDAIAELEEIATNNENSTIREEAKIALEKAKGFQGNIS